MEKYISVNNLIYDIERSRADNQHNNTIAAQTHIAEHRHFIKMVLDQPAANVVKVEADLSKVVRCKDCKHATFYSCKNDACYQSIICEYKIGIGDEDFFCACGERR